MFGWIKLHRKFTNWEHFKNPNCLRLFLYCLLQAEYDDCIIDDVPIARGQFKTTLSKISRDTGLSIQKIRTATQTLTQEITQTSAQRYSIITVIKYDSYQDRHEKNNTNYNTNFNTKSKKPLSFNKEYIKNIKEVKEILCMINNEFEYISQAVKPLNSKQLDKLITKGGASQVKEKLKSLEKKKGLNPKGKPYIDIYLTLNNWIKPKKEQSDGTDLANFYGA